MFKTVEAKRAYERNWYQTIGKEKRKATNLKWRTRKREEFAKLKSTLRCKICGESHPACLDFHHKDSTQKENEIARLATNGSSELLEKELKKCDVLCANCHRKLHYKPLSSNGKTVAL